MPSEQDSNRTSQNVRGPLRTVIGVLGAIATFYILYWIIGMIVVVLLGI